MHSVDRILGTNDVSPEFLVVGKCDVIVSGLSAGAVKLQYKLPASAVLPNPGWVNHPDGNFTTDVFKTIFVSEMGVMMRLQGVANNGGVYVRIGRYVNK